MKIKIDKPSMTHITISEIILLRNDIDCVSLKLCTIVSLNYRIRSYTQ